MFNKRGLVPESETVHVTGLIILIAILIVIYMILIPPQAQKEILEKGQLSDSLEISNSGESKIKSLLFESPGFVFPQSKEKEKISLPPINLFSKTRQEITTLAKSVTVTRSIFSDNFYDMKFKIKPEEEIKSLKLFFNSISSKGSLVIYLNEQIVFKGKVSKEDIPLEIPVSDLNNENIMRISASSPGWRFLSINKHELKDVKLIKETSSENKKEVRTFNIEKDKIKKSALSYFVNCLKINEEQGILKISLNDFNIFLGKIICDASQQNIQVQKDYFKNTENTLTFEIDRSNYVIEQIEISVDSDKEKSLTYFFDISKEDLDNKIMLRLNLVPNKEDERSTATLLINSNTVTLDTNKKEFTKDISSLLKEDENFIKIIPKNEFEIISLEIFTK